MSKGPLLATLAVALYAAWAVPLLPWLARSLGDEDGLLRALVVAAGLGLALTRREPGQQRAASVPALAWALLPPLLAPLFPSLQTAQVLLAVATGYGLLGLALP